MEFRLTEREANVLRAFLSNDSISLPQLTVNSLTAPSELDSILDGLQRKSLVVRNESSVTLSPMGRRIRDDLTPNLSGSSRLPPAGTSGAAAGAAIGFIVGGPIGAILGGVVGSTFGRLLAADAEKIKVNVDSANKPVAK